MLCRGKKRLWRASRGITRKKKEDVGVGVLPQFVTLLNDAMSSMTSSSSFYNKLSS